MIFMRGLVITTVLVLSACASRLEWPTATTYGQSSGSDAAIVRNRFQEGTPASISAPEIHDAVSVALSVKRRVEDDFGFKNSNTRVEEVKSVGQATVIVRISMERGGDGFEQLHVLERPLKEWKHIHYYEVPTWSARS